MKRRFKIKLSVPVYNMASTIFSEIQFLRTKENGAFFNTNQSTSNTYREQESVHEANSVLRTVCNMNIKKANFKLLPHVEKL